MLKKVSCLLLFLLIIAGCSNEEAKKSGNQENVQADEAKQEKEVEEEPKNNSEEDFSSYFKDIPEVPKTQEDFINQLPGKYAGTPEGWEEKLKKEITDLPPLPESPTEQQYNQYFKYAYSLVAEDFPDPADLIGKLRFSMFGNPDIQDTRFQFKENYNIEIILDSSGSMAVASGGEPRMELAKQAIEDFVANVPEEANVSLRVYGHKGTGSDADKANSCASIEQVYGFEKYNEEEFSKALNQFEPSGWTPVAGALESSKEAFEKYDAENNTNLIYLVSDGIETCDGNPVEIAKTFADSNISPIINVIGLNVDSETQKQLQEVAESANGVYSTVANGEQLAEEFERAEKVLEKWEDWKDDSLSDIDAQRVDNSFEILGYMNDWNSSGLSQGVTINRIINFLEEQEKMQFKDEEILRKKLNDMKELENGISKEMRAYLEDLNKSNFEEISKKINEKYQSNIQQ